MLFLQGSKLQRCAFYVVLTLLAVILDSRVCSGKEEDAARRTLRKLMKSKNKGMGITLYSIRPHESSEVEKVAAYADLGTECDYEKYKDVSWVEYYGNDPECLESTLQAKMTQTAENPEQFKALCYNPKKILECRISEKCACATGTRWKLEQHLTLEGEECHVGEDGDCGDEWAKCLKSLSCEKKGTDHDGNLVQRCTLSATPNEILTSEGDHVTDGNRTSDGHALGVTPLITSCLLFSSLVTAYSFIIVPVFVK